MAEPPVSRVWVLAFFVLGVVIGLLLLVLEQGPFVVGPEAASAPALPGTPGQASSRQSAAPRLKRSEPKRDAPQQGAAAPMRQEVAEQLQPLQCDRGEAEAVVQRARSLATLSERGGLMQLSLTRDWEFYSPGHRRSFVEAFSEADRCLRGHFRQLRFLYRGELVATVSAEGAVEMLEH